ncbi:MAG: hypothetical protein Q9218_004104 [Villophora microphyllina]
MTAYQDGKSKPQQPQQQPAASESVTRSPLSEECKDQPSYPPTRWQGALSVILYTPKRCRYDPANPPRFSLPLNLLFGFAAAFTVANLYYNHPILHLLAGEFGVSNERASLIPTLAQAGYASGLLFLCPLVSDLALPHRRATALSVVVSGLLMGMLLARLLSGAVTNYTSWRKIYWIASGLQYLIFALLWLFMPDYPSPNPAGINYFRILWSILTISIHHPLLVQACLIGFCTSTTFTSFWTTLTFLLSSPPYEYSTLVIGLFALIGIAAMFLGPLYSHNVTDRFIPLFSVILGLSICLTGTIIGTYTGSFSVAGPIIQAFALDFGIQTSQIANRSAIYAILPQARNRVNTAYMLSAFCGQLTGTALGNHIYAIGGWTSSGSTSVGFLSAALLLCFIRGPREKGWIGWGGGWALKRQTDNVIIANKRIPIDEEKNTEVGGVSGTLDDRGIQDHERKPYASERRERGQGSVSGDKETEEIADIDISKPETGRFAGMGNRQPS